jgi:hypothetical protein
MTKEELREVNRQTRDKDRLICTDKMKNITNKLIDSHLRFAAMVREKMEVSK